MCQMRVDLRSVLKENIFTVPISATFFSLFTIDVCKAFSAVFLSTIRYFSCSFFISYQINSWSKWSRSVSALSPERRGKLFSATLAKKKDSIAIKIPDALTPVEITLSDSILRDKLFSLFPFSAETYVLCPRALFQWHDPRKPRLRPALQSRSLCTPSFWSEGAIRATSESCSQRARSMKMINNFYYWARQRKLYYCCLENTWSP